MVDTSTLTSAASPALTSGLGAMDYANIASTAASGAADVAKALQDSSSSAASIGDVKFGDVSNVSGGGGFGLSNKKLIYIGGFILAGMLIYGLAIKK